MQQLTVREASGVPQLLEEDRCRASHIPPHSNVFIPAGDKQQLWNQSRALRFVEKHALEWGH